MSEKDKILLKLKKSISTTAPNATVILYGSQARGDANENSDYDLLILLNKETITRDDEIRIKYPLYDIEFDTGKIISPLIITKSDWELKHKITPFYRNVLKEGVYL